MYFKVAILLCFLALDCADLSFSKKIFVKWDESKGSNDRLVGGHDAEIGEFPHMVSVQCIAPNLGLYFCGGSIIDPQWILTAAHCIKTYLQDCPKDSLYIVAGKHNISVIEPNDQLAKVEKYIVHEKYKMNDRLPRDDVALLKLVNPLKINKYVNPVKLPQPDTEPEGNAVLSGWGFNNPQETNHPQILQTVDVTIISRKLCNESISILNPDFTIFLEDTNLCTGPLSGGVAHCGGDSGGPLTVNVGGIEELVGVVSWGFKECGIKSGPSVFAKVSAYANWLADKMATN